jgi:hypothetical protein
MYLCLKGAIGAAGIAVGFLLWQGSPAGASELVKDPLAAAKVATTPAVAAVDDVAGHVTSGEPADVKASAGFQATERFGNSGGTTKSNVAFEGSEARLAHASGGRIDAEAPRLLPDPADTNGEAKARAEAGVTARARPAEAKLRRLEPTTAERTPKRHVAKAKRTIEREGAAGRELPVDELEDAKDEIGAAWRPKKLGECACELEGDELADELDDEAEDALEDNVRCVPQTKGGATRVLT